MKVLYISGYNDEALVGYGVSTTEIAFLEKPFAPLSLVDKVREVVDENET